MDKKRRGMPAKLKLAKKREIERASALKKFIKKSSSAAVSPKEEESLAKTFDKFYDAETGKVDLPSMKNGGIAVRGTGAQVKKTKFKGVF